MEQYFKLDAPLYVNKRYNHAGCSDGKDDCLIVTRFPTHWKWYCHRCHRGGEELIDNLPPGEMVKLWKANRIYKDRPRQQAKEVRLPEDFTTNIEMFHPVAVAWLMIYGITEEEILKYSIGYSPYYKRVIFPVYQEDELVYWQGRTVEEIAKDNPKWINIKQLGRKDIYFKAFGPGKLVVLVEDIISAIKVGRVRTAIALLGSYIPESLMLSLYDFDVTIWLDEDKRMEAIKYLNRMRSLGVQCRLRVTPKDPKGYTTEEIKEKLS